MSTDDFKRKYSLHIPHIEETWAEINGIEGVNMIVEKEGLTNYGQVLSIACETVATCYNNYYVENFENIVSNYFIYMVHSVFPDLRMSVIKYIAHMDALFSDESATIMADSIASSLNDQTQDQIHAFLNPLIVEIRNRLPSLPVTKETFNKAPIDIMPTFRHIQEKYQSIIAENQQPTPAPQSPVVPQVCLTGTIRAVKPATEKTKKEEGSKKQRSKKRREQQDTVPATETF